MSSLIDWSDAAGVAGRLVRPGPAASRGEIADLVGSLRHAAYRAVEPVAGITRMTPANASRVSPADLSRVHVVDRPGWARAGAQSMDAMTAGALVSPTGRPLPLVADVATTAEVGAMLAYLSTRILGQFDPYSLPATPDGTSGEGSGEGRAAGTTGTAGPGRLLLVAPNVLHVERQLRVNQEDFRLWVCLHEQTHALQFAAAPWLAGHLQDRTRALVGGLSTTQMGLRDVAPRLGAVLRAVYAAVRGRPGGSLVDGLLTPDQRVVLAEVTAVMSLLEGHADVAMDAVGPRTVRSVRTIRRRFEARRDTSGGADGVLRRLLGMDAKIAQYRDGAGFVRGVTAVVGSDGLNAVWSGPDALPRAAEIADPGAWVRRIHG